MAYEFRFPDVGEGISEGELLAWKVSEGESVAEDQTLAEVETDKAVVELPSPKAGTIARLHAAEGDVIEVGSVLVTIEESGASAAGAGPKGEPAAAEQAEPEVAPAETEEPAPGPEPAAEAVEPEEPEEPYTGSVVGQLEEAPEEEPQPRSRPAPASKDGTKILALPSVRALAKELGVDLSTIRGTGTGGRILKQDVEDVAQAMAYGEEARPAASPPAAPPRPSEEPEKGKGETEEPGAPAMPVAVGTAVHGGTLEEDSFGPVERVPIRGIRRTMAKRMSESATKQAQVTTMDQADVTIIRRIREKEREVASERGVHLTYLAFVVKACASALQRFPRLNAVFEESGEDYIIKRYYNIGMAVDTKDGLVVPNIKDADKKSIFTIAEDIIDLVNKADARTLDLAELHGGTFTITNYGSIGGTFATPIANYPEVAILGMGRIEETPAMRNGEVVARLVLPLSLTFDHRLIDGAEAARFLNLVVGYLEDPDLLLLESV